MFSRIHITLGGGTDLGIDEKDQLFVIDYAGNKVELGLATTRRFNQLREYLHRLEIHAIEEKVL
jgi:hypothetical protein